MLLVGFLLLLLLTLSQGADNSTSFIIVGSWAGLSNRLRLLTGYIWVAQQKYDNCHIIMVWDVNNVRSISIMQSIHSKY
jgi:hypothetical protein